MTASTVTKTLLMGVAVATTGALGLALSEPAQALGFTGDYAPGNFALTNTNADGSVVTSGAPNSISIFGGNNLSGTLGLTSFLTTAAGTGLVSFNWNYVTRESAAFYDPFGYILNGAFVQLTNNSLANQSGNISFNVALGDSFGFGVRTTDNFFGPGGATISNFNAPTAIPTPALLPGLMALGASVLRKRQAAAVEETSEA